MKSVIITGGDGFIGTHLTKYLTERDFEVYAVVMKNSPTKERLLGIKGTHIIEFDLALYDNAISSLPSIPEAFLHFA